MTLIVSDPKLAAPSSDIDLYSDETLSDPYPAYRELRDMGPAVWMNSVNAWFLGRYETVRAAMRDWKSWSSAQGVGLNSTINNAQKKAVLANDPPAHTQMRKLFTDRLSASELRGVEQTIDQRADELAERIVAVGEFDAVSDVASNLPITVVMDLIGWPMDARASLYELAKGTFSAWGPDNERMRAAIARYQSIRKMITEIYHTGTLIPGGFGSTIAEAAKRGEYTDEEAIGNLSGYVVAAFDTTVNAIANGMVIFAGNPKQWDLLRENPSYADVAFSEILRFDSPVQSFARVATRDIDLGEGVIVPAGDRAIMSFGSSNRDERRFPDPDTFNMLRRPLDHLGFGMGIHICAGQTLARMEGEAVFRSLARKIKRLELTDEPTRELINIGRGYSHAPMRAVAM